MVRCPKCGQETFETDFDGKPFHSCGCSEAFIDSANLSLQRFRELSEAGIDIVSLLQADQVKQIQELRRQEEAKMIEKSAC